MTKPKSKPKAYSYLRFSTPEQLKGDSQRRQTQLAAEYALRHGLDLDRELNLRDLGVSAYRGDNVETGALGAFLDATRKGIVEPGSLLLVESLDRVSRKVARKAVRILEDIVEAGVTVVTLNDGKQYTAESLDGFDFVMAVLILIRANEESATKAKRLKAAWIGKRQKAADKALTAHTVGWIELDDQRRPVLIEDHAKVVRRIVKAYLSGTGKHSIAQALNQERVPPFGRAKIWHRSYIDKILTSPALVGTIIPHVEEHKDGKMRRIPQAPVANYYPAVIDAETYERLQALNRASPLRGRHANKTMRSVLSGLARCPACNSTMTRVTKGNGSKGGHPFLICTRAKTGAGCQYHAVRYEVVEQTILKSYESILGDMPSPDASIERALRDAEATVSDLADRLDGLMRLLERRPSDTLARRVAELEANLKEAQAERDEVLTRASQAEGKVLKLKAQALGVAIRARPVNRERINAALRELLDGVVVDYRTGYLEFRWRAGGESSVMYAWPDERAAKG